ncbi:MAG: RHS repeat-associated core domain-containing protein [Prevotella sp.]
MIDLAYHRNGTRYYACWLGRWTASDPAGLVDGVNLYMYVRGNPVRLHDPSGNAGAPPECTDQIDYNLPNQDVKAFPDNPTLGGMRWNASGFFSPDASSVQVPNPSNTSSGPQWVQGPGPGLRERIVKEGGPIALISLTLYDISDDAYIVAQKVAGGGNETTRLSGEFVSDIEAQDALVNTLTLFIFSGGSSSGRVAEGFADDAAKVMAKESSQSVPMQLGKEPIDDMTKSMNESAQRILSNKAAGDARSDFLQSAYGGKREVTKSTSLGIRRIDNLTDGLAQESKLGRTSLTSTTRLQIAKDLELVTTPGSGVTSLEWHFFPSKTGVGPTVPLENELIKAKIPFIIH